MSTCNKAIRLCCFFFNCDNQIIDDLSLSYRSFILRIKMNSKRKCMINNWKREIKMRIVRLHIK